MKFLDFGSLGFYRFFDFQKHLNFSIFRYSLINYYSYKEQSSLINDANLLKSKIVFLDKVYKDIARVVSTSSKLNDSLNLNKKIFCDALVTIKNLIKKYYPSSEFLNLEYDVLLSNEDTFNKFLDKLRYLNFRVDLRKRLRNLIEKIKPHTLASKLPLFLLKKSFWKDWQIRLIFFLMRLIIIVWI